MSKRNRLPRKAGSVPTASDQNRKTASHRRHPPEPSSSRGPWPDGTYWLYGSHAVRSALTNPRRRFRRLLIAAGDPDGGALGAAAGLPVAPESVERPEISRLLPDGAVHQGVAALVHPLPPVHVKDVCDQAAALERATVVVLDQVTDPHNVGAILRSAAAFGALAVVLTDRNAPPETGALAKSASGALEHVSVVRVANLVRALDQFKEAGFWCAGLAAEGGQTLAEARLSGRVALVLGSEGEGLRRLTRERCDLLVRLPTRGPIGHLNVSNAAAIGLYELARTA